MPPKKPLPPDAHPRDLLKVPITRTTRTTRSSNELENLVSPRKKQEEIPKSGPPIAGHALEFPRRSSKSASRMVPPTGEKMLEPSSMFGESESLVLPRQRPSVKYSSWSGTSKMALEAKNSSGIERVEFGPFSGHALGRKQGRGDLRTSAQEEEEIEEEEPNEYPPTILGRINLAIEVNGYTATILTQLRGFYEKVERGEMSGEGVKEVMRQWPERDLERRVYELRGVVVELGDLMRGEGKVERNVEGKVDDSEPEEEEEVY